MPTVDALNRRRAKTDRRRSVALGNTSSSCNVSLRSLNELKPNPRSARTHPKRKIKELAKAIKTVGFIGVIVVDESGMILAGHARHAAAKLLGMKTVPTICVTGLSDELVRAFVIADNKFYGTRRLEPRDVGGRSSRSCRCCCRPSISIFR